MCGIIPFATLEIHTVNVATILWLFFDVLVGPVVLDVELEVQTINSDLVLS